jgi:hypothetical protein
MPCCGLTSYRLIVGYKFANHILLIILRNKSNKIIPKILSAKNIKTKNVIAMIEIIKVE